MTSTIPDYDKLSAGLADLLVSAAAQAFDTNAATKLAEHVNAQGKITPTRAPAPKKKVAVTTTESLTGMDKFMRPNGEAYYTRKWGEHDDVMVLR